MDYKSLLFNIDIPSGHTPAPGALLVSEPFLHEEYFNHAVIALVEYEPNGGAMGVVLNNVSDYSLQDLVEGVTVKEPVPVYCGGPMAADRLFFIHTLGDIIPGTQPLGNGLWIGGEFDPMLSIINDRYELEGNIRFFLGYSGWSDGQLEEELSRNVWAVSPMSGSGHELLKGDGDAHWHRAVRSLGTDFRGWLYHPQNPMVN